MDTLPRRQKLFFSFLPPTPIPTPPAPATPPSCAVVLTPLSRFQRPNNGRLLTDLQETALNVVGCSWDFTVVLIVVVAAVVVVVIAAADVTVPMWSFVLVMLFSCFFDVKKNKPNEIGLW